MIMMDAYKDDMEEQLRGLTPAQLNRLPMSVDEILNDYDTADSLWYHYQKCVSEYGCDPDYAILDAIQETMGVNLF